MKPALFSAFKGYVVPCTWFLSNKIEFGNFIFFFFTINICSVNFTSSNKKKNKKTFSNLGSLNKKKKWNANHFKSVILYAFLNFFLLHKTQPIEQND